MPSVELAIVTESFEGKRVLITGGLGFIGSNLAACLVASGADVTVVDCLLDRHGGNEQNVQDIRGRLKVYLGSMADPAALDVIREGVDYVFNLAAQTSHWGSMEAPGLDLQMNAQAQLALLETCRGLSKPPKIVFTSTRQVYGRTSATPVDESHPIAPADINAVHKFAAERYHLLYRAVHGVPTCVLRLTNTYGPRMRVRDAHQSVLGKWIGDVLCGRDVEVYGDGRQFRDFTYVDDCVDALLRAAATEASEGKVYNLGGEVMTLGDLAEALVRAAGVGRVKLVPFPATLRAIDIGSYRADYASATRDLGWQPRMPLAEGLRRSLHFFRDRGAPYGLSP